MVAVGRSHAGVGDRWDGMDTVGYYVYSRRMAWVGGGCGGSYEGLSVRTVQKEEGGMEGGSEVGFYRIHEGIAYPERSLSG